MKHQYSKPFANAHNKKILKAFNNPLYIDNEDYTEATHDAVHKDIKRCGPWNEMSDQEALKKLFEENGLIGTSAVNVLDELRSQEQQEAIQRQRSQQVIDEINTRAPDWLDSIGKKHQKNLDVIDELDSIKDTLYSGIKTDIYSKKYGKKNTLI